MVVLVSDGGVALEALRCLGEQFRGHGQVGLGAGEVDVAVGSAVGGNILLFTVGYGLVILLAYKKHGQIIELKPTMKDDLWYLIIASLYLLIASIDRKLTLTDGIVLTVLYFVFLFVLIIYLLLLLFHRLCLW